MLDSYRNVVLACMLTALAGYVDGIGFIHLGGLFVSYMSGNSTRMGVSLAAGDWPKAIEALGLIGLFVVGAMAGSLIVLGGGRHRQVLLLFAEAALLASAPFAEMAGWPGAAVAAIVVAMGLENAMFQVAGSAGIGLTYVTGALVKLGQLLALAMTGRERWGWVPQLLLWIALAGGSLLGGLAYRGFELKAIWFAAAAALMLCAGVAVADRRRH